MSMIESRGAHLVQVHLVERDAVNRRLGLAELLKQMLARAFPAGSAPIRRSAPISPAFDARAARAWA